MVDLETKLKIYMLIVSRYKNLISKSEEKSITEIRERCSPHQDFIKLLKTRLAPHEPYSYASDFLSAVDRVLGYSRSIQNIELLLTFWMDFKDIDTIKASNLMDKALLITALLRAFGSESARIFVTKKTLYVGFEYRGLHMILVESGMLLSGEPVRVRLQSDPPLYSFNDLSYETYDGS